MKYTSDKLAQALFESRQTEELSNIEVPDKISADNTVLESSDWSGYKVRYTYPGDDLSDYEGTCIVRADNEKQAINIAKVELRDIKARNLKIDGEIKSYNDYKKKYPHSNFEIFEAKKLKKGDTILFKDYSIKLGNYNGKTDSFATIKYDKSGSNKLDDKVSTTRREWLENQISNGSAIMESNKVIKSGEVKVNKAFTIKEFDEDDGWQKITIKPGKYKYQVIDFRGWKPRQLFINNEWIDVADNCRDLEEILSNDTITEGSTKYHYTGKTLLDLDLELQKDGLTISLGDYSDIKYRPKNMNGKRIVIHSKDGKTYKGTFNKYYNGNLEIIDVEQIQG